jgi:hypothetical protein
MKVIRTRVGVLVGSCGLLASAFGLTVITVGPAAAGTMSIASLAGVASLRSCPNATVIEAGQCA